MTALRLDWTSTTNDDQSVDYEVRVPGTLPLLLVVWMSTRLDGVPSWIWEVMVDNSSQLARHPRKEPGHATHLAAQLAAEAAALALLTEAVAAFGVEASKPTVGDVAVAALTAPSCAVTESWIAEKAADLTEEYRSGHRDGDGVRWLRRLLKGMRIPVIKRMTDAPPADREWVVGFCTALAESHRRLVGGADSTGVCEVARNAGITLDRAKACGLEDYDLRELKRAGVLAAARVKP